MFELDEELKKLPDQPGVYIMHDSRDEIIYVGKAISLTNRVRHHIYRKSGFPNQTRASVFSGKP